MLQGDQQIFSNEVRWLGLILRLLEIGIRNLTFDYLFQLLSSRVGEQKRALEEVQVRHNQIQQIESALIELFELTQEMQTMLEQQQVSDDVLFQSIFAMTLTLILPSPTDYSQHHRREGRRHGRSDRSR